MRILYLHQYFTTPEFSGGVRSYQFARRLVAAGHQVDLITSPAFYPIKKKKKHSLISKCVVDGITVHVIHVNYGNELTFFRRVVSFFLFMLISSAYVLRVKDYDLIYATSTPLTIGVPALVAKFLRRKPLIFEVRDMWPDIPIALGFIKNPLLIKVLSSFERFLYDRASRIVALSVGMKEEITSKGIDESKVTVIPNAADLVDFDHTTIQPQVERLRKNEDSRVCLYAGTFGYVNDLSYLVSLAASLKAKKADIKLLLIGNGAEKELIAKQIKEHELEDFVVLRPPVSKNELVSYIKSSDACFSTVRDIPALFNNSANKFFDALAAGKPIIINHGGWQAGIIEENDIGLVLGRDMEQAAGRLIEYLNGVTPADNKRIAAFGGRNYDRDILFKRLLFDVLEPSV